MVERAIRNRWPIRQEIRDSLPEKVWEILSNPDSDPRTKVNAASVFMAMDRLNQTDEQFDETNRRKDGGKEDGTLRIEVAYVDRPRIED